MTTPLFVFAIVGLLAASVSAEKVRTVTPRATLNYLSLPVAEAKGFFRDESLENETIIIPGSTAIAALVSGEVDYSGAGGERHSHQGDHVSDGEGYVVSVERSRCA